MFANQVRGVLVDRPITLSPTPATVSGEHPRTDTATTAMGRPCAGLACRSLAHSRSSQLGTALSFARYQCAPYVAISAGSLAARQI